MNNLLLRLAVLRHDKRAVTALEYGLIAACVVAVGLAAFSAIGGSLANEFANVDAVMDAAP